MFPGSSDPGVFLYLAYAANTLKKLAYGNGDSVQYTYNGQGQVTSQTYEDGDKVTYRYGNSGELASVTDSGSGITQHYAYDLIDHLAQYRETRDRWYIPSHRKSNTPSPFSEKGCCFSKRISSRNPGFSWHGWGGAACG